MRFVLINSFFPCFTWNSGNSHFFKIVFWTDHLISVMLHHPVKRSILLDIRAHILVGWHCQIKALFHRCMHLVDSIPLFKVFKVLLAWVLATVWHHHLLSSMAPGNLQSDLKVTCFILTHFWLGAYISEHLALLGMPDMQFLGLHLYQLRNSRDCSTTITCYLGETFSHQICLPLEVFQEMIGVCGCFLVEMALVWWREWIEICPCHDPDYKESILHQCWILEACLPPT